MLASKVLRGVVGLRPKKAGDLRIYAIAATVAVLALPACGFLFWVAEQGHNPSIVTLGDSFEWLLRTLVEQESKVDIETTGGHLAYLIVVFSGITLVGTGTGAIVSHLIQAAKERRTGVLRDSTRSNHVVVCGWNSRGLDILRELTMEDGDGHKGVTVIASLPDNPFIDAQEADPGLLKDVDYVRGDPRSKEALRRAGLERAAGVIVLAGEEGISDHEARSTADAVTLLTALVVKSVSEEAGKSTYITAEVLSGETTSHFRDNAIHYVTHGEILPALLARDVRNAEIFEVVKELVSVEGQDLYIDPTPESMVGWTFGRAVNQLKTDCEVILLGVRNDANMEAGAFLNPTNSCPIESGSSLIYLAKDRKDWRTYSPSSVNR